MEMALQHHTKDGQRAANTIDDPRQTSSLATALLFTNRCDAEAVDRIDLLKLLRQA